MKPTKPNIHEEIQDSELNFADCVLHTHSNGAELVIKNGRSYTVTAREGVILSVLVKNQGTVIGKDELITAAWGNPETIGSNSLPVAISNLRRILQPEGINIINVPRQGYRLMFDAQSQAQENENDNPNNSNSQQQRNKSSYEQEPLTQGFDHAQQQTASKVSAVRYVSVVVCAICTCILIFYLWFSWVDIRCQHWGQGTVCSPSEVNIEQLLSQDELNHISKGVTYFIDAEGQRYEAKSND